MRGNSKQQRRRKRTDQMRTSHGVRHEHEACQIPRQQISLQWRKRQPGQAAEATRAVAQKDHCAFPGSVVARQYAMHSSAAPRWMKAREHLRTHDAPSQRSLFGTAPAVKLQANDLPGVAGRERAAKNIDAANTHWCNRCWRCRSLDSTRSTTSQRAVPPVSASVCPMRTTAPRAICSASAPP